MPDRIKPLLPRFVDYVVWRAGEKGRGQIEVALFPNPVALAPDVEVSPGAGAPSDGRGSDGRSFVHEYQMGSLSRLSTQHPPLAWDPDLEEVPDRPLSMIMSDPCFAVFRGRRRRFVTGEAPAGVAGDRAVRARDWRAYQNRMTEEPAWERAERYRRLMEEKGYKSIRELARAIAEDHSRVARVLKILDLPEMVLAELRKHSTNVRVRAHFTEKRLRKLAERAPEAKILREIAEVIQARA